MDYLLFHFDIDIDLILFLPLLLVFFQAHGKLLPVSSPDISSLLPKAVVWRTKRSYPIYYPIVDLLLFLLPNPQQHDLADKRISPEGNLLDQHDRQQLLSRALQHLDLVTALEKRVNQKFFDHE